MPRRCSWAVRGRRHRPRSAPVVTADAAGFLEGCPPRSFDGLTLSNILDGADEAYGERLFEAVRRAAAPGAVAILRSFGEPMDDDEAVHAADDRALIWGSVRMERL